MKKQKNIIVFVMNMLPRMAADIRQFEAENGKKYRLMLLWDSAITLPETKKGFDILVCCLDGCF